MSCSIARGNCLQVGDSSFESVSLGNSVFSKVSLPSEQAHQSFILRLGLVLVLCILSFPKNISCFHSKAISRQ